MKNKTSNFIKINYSILVLILSAIIPQTSHAYWGIENCHQSPEINARYYYIACFDKNGFAIVTPSRAQMQPMGMIDQTGKEVLPLKYQSISTVQLPESSLNNPNGYILKYQDKFSYIDARLKLTDAVDYDDLILPYSQFEILIAVKDKHYVLLNWKGQTISKQYDHIRARYRTIIAKKNGKFGYLDPQGRPITPFIYDSAGEFDEQGRAQVVLADEKFYIDTHGNPVR